MNREHRWFNFGELLRSRPKAWAVVKGSTSYPRLFGIVRFYDTPYGTLVAAQVQGLPNTYIDCSSPVFAFHIHEGSACLGSLDDPFSDTRMHYNPQGCPHPYHAGDLPPLFGADGNAFSVCLTDRFTASEVVGKTVIIHSSYDDFSTQPSGNAGKKIACGEILGYNRK